MTRVRIVIDVRGPQELAQWLRQAAIAVESRAVALEPGRAYPMQAHDLAAPGFKGVIGAMSVHSVPVPPSAGG